MKYRFVFSEHFYLLLFTFFQTVLVQLMGKGLPENLPLIPTMRKISTLFLGLIILFWHLFLGLLCPRLPSRAPIA